MFKNSSLHYFLPRVGGNGSLIKKFFFLLLLPVAFVFSAKAQSSTITGTVKNNSGEAIEGVSVVIKNSSTGTSTGANGQFSITVKERGDTLVFTYVGFETKEMAARPGSPVNVVLSPNTVTGNEVIVVGYGTQSKRNVTGSVSKADLARTENLPNTNITQAIRGSVAGVQV
ncbi:MAG TPA: carboxypeptidase-like regulatory domain-containing protein, partial [Flavitalea sp.]|nr:carboxypeptidase-like regulatory domain-containing protein [Flavitalea sp.]